MRRLAGSADGLTTERSYVRRTLPAGVRRGIAAGLRGHVSGFARAAAICFGLACTALGFLVGTVVGLPVVVALRSAGDRLRRAG